MGKEAMMLSKDYDRKRLVPGMKYLVSEKYDGVPGVFHWRDGHFINLSRQHTEFVSAPHIQNALAEVVPNGLKVIGEQYIPGIPFKDISGKVRKGVPCPDMQLRIFDYDTPKDLDYEDRFYKATELIHSVESEYIRFVKQYYCYTHEDIMLVWQRVLADNPQAEGIMIRPASGPMSKYKYGRSWGMMRYVPKPTKDLLVVDFEEATANKDQSNGIKKGDGLGMVGRIVCKFGDSTTGVGPGRATHAERREWFLHPDKLVGHIVKVQFKRDAFYNKLRQPTYQCHRHDKDTPDA